MAPGSENKIKLTPWPRDLAKVFDSEMAIFDHFYKFTQDYTNIFQKHKVQTLIKVLKVFKVFRVLILQVLSANRIVPLRVLTLADCNKSGSFYTVDFLRSPIRLILSR